MNKTFWKNGAIKAGKFISMHKKHLAIGIGAFAGIVAGDMSAAFAAGLDQAGNGVDAAATVGNNLGVITTPLATLVNFVKGPLAGITTVGAMIIGLASYQLGWDQSVTKKCGVAVACGAAMTQCDVVIAALGIDVSALPF